MKLFGKTLTRKQENTFHDVSRALIQLLFFIFMPSIFTTAFAGIKAIFTAIGSGQTVELTSFVKVLLGILLFTIIFGRFFCGYACPFGSLGDLFRFLYQKICKALKKKPLKLAESVTGVLRYVKYLVLVAIVVLCFFNVYSVTQGYSPWDVFSMLRSGNFHLAGYIGGLVLLVLIIVGMCLEDRFFCRFLCPMGAVFSLMPVLPFLAVTRNRENCLGGCQACHKKCPCGVEPANRKNYKVMGECIDCNQCLGVCPKKNIGTQIPKLRGNETWFVLVKAAGLFAFMKLLGV